MRSAVVLALALLAACEPAYPSAFHVRAVAEAPADRAAVLVWEPWSAGMHDVAIVPRGGAVVLAYLDGVKITCTNAPCEQRQDGRSLLVKERPPGDRLELTVEKDGFEPAHVTVALPAEGRAMPDVVVPLRPRSAS